MENTQTKAIDHYVQHNDQGVRLDHFKALTFLKDLVLKEDSSMISEFHNETKRFAEPDIDYNDFAKFLYHFLKKINIDLLQFSLLYFEHYYSDNKS